MRVDMREHREIRDQVHAGIAALRVQGRQIWGDTRHTLPEISVRLMVGVGDLARVTRDRLSPSSGWVGYTDEQMAEIKKELGRISEAYPDAISKENLSAATGYAHTSSTFNNGLSALRTLELITRGTIRLSEELTG